MADNEENATAAAVPPNSETNTVVETTEIMETLPVSEISQGNDNNTMDIVSMALSNVTDTANLMAVVDSNVVTAVEEVEHVELDPDQAQVVQQFEQIEVVEQQVVHEIPISNDMIITSADGQFILPSNSTPEELSAVETLVGGALQQTVLAQQADMTDQQVVVESVVQDAIVSSVQMTPVPMTLTTSVPVVESSNSGLLHLGHVGGGAQNISASSLLGSIATMIDSTEASIGNTGSLVGMKINTTMAQAGGNFLTRTAPSNVTFANASVVSSVPTIEVANTNINQIMPTSSTNVVATTSTAMGLNSVITAPKQSTSLPSTITIKTPPGSNSVSQSLLNSILNNSDVQSLLKRNPGQPITIVRVPEDSPGGKNVNKITVTTGKAPAAKPTVTFQTTTPAAKPVMRISTPISKPSTVGLKSSNTPNSNSNKVGRPRGRPPRSLSKEPPPPPVVVKSKKTRSGRLSRPPLHRVRDYKTIHIQEMGDGNDERDDFTDYDGELMSQSQTEFQSYGGRPKSFKCDQCDRAYIGKGGLARHFKNNPSHGDPAELGVTYDDEEETGSVSEQRPVTPVQPIHTPFIKRKKRGRPPAQPANGDPDFHPNRRIPLKAGGKIAIDLATQNLNRKKQRIQELIKTIGDEDLMELALPRLSKAITVWEFLLMKVEEAHSQELPFREILQQFESVRKHVRLFADECLERVAVKQESAKGVGKSNEDNALHDVQSTSDTAIDKELPLQNSVTEKGDSSETNRVTEETSQETADTEDQSKKSSESSPSKSMDTSPEQTEISANDLEAGSSSSESKSKTENGSKELDLGSKSTSVSTDEESRTNEKQTDSLKDEQKIDDEQTESPKNGQRTEDKQTESSIDGQKTDDNQTESSSSKDVQDDDDQTQKSTEISSAKSKETETEPGQVEISNDFLELESEIAKALGMEPGRYNIKEWMTTKLPAMFKFSKTGTDDHEGYMSEEEDEIVDEDASETPAKKQKMEEVERPMPPLQQFRQVPQIQLPKENNIPQKPQAPIIVATRPLPQQTATAVSNSAGISSTLPPLTPISLSGAGDAGSATAVVATAAADRQQAIQQVVQQIVEGTQVVHQVEEVQQEPMEIIEQSHQVVEDEPEATEEAVEYQTEEEQQGHSIVPEGSTIMQMEDGTFLVQKPDGTAMQIHCPEGMTIETIQALLSMDAGNMLQSAE